jgi:catechol 2,3-dioxygenase-like lactoylglutathione lyase family enzyme
MNASAATGPQDAPRLDGIHHVKLPVSDLERSADWYASRLGFRRQLEFVEGGVLMGVTMVHPNGGPMLGLRLDPDRAAAAAGFDYFAIGVSDEATLRALAERLTGFGEPHAGVHFASIGWILPMLRDPDGHEVRFYTTDHHTDYDDVSTGGDQVVRIENPRETAERREQELAR